MDAGADRSSRRLRPHLRIVQETHGETRHPDGFKDESFAEPKRANVSQHRADEEEIVLPLDGKPSGPLSSVLPLPQEAHCTEGDHSYKDPTGHTQSPGGDACTERKKLRR